MWMEARVRYIMMGQMEKTHHARQVLSAIYAVIQKVLFVFTVEMRVAA